MKIPHLTEVDRSKFYPLVRDAIRNAGGQWPIVVALGKGGGYEGSVKVILGAATEAEFEAQVELNDWTRFPARIRAACTALRDGGQLGSFEIAHHDGILTIK